MGVLDKFLDIMKLSDDDDYDENDDFFDDEYDDEYEEKPAKKGILNRFKSKDTYDDYDDADEGYDDYSSRQSKASHTVSNKVTPMRQPARRSTGVSMEVCVIKPSSVEDAREITETLLQDCTVVLNLEGLDIDLSQRVIDYSSGSCYAVGGNLQRVSSYIFIITPAGVSISGDFQELLNGAVDIPAAGAKFQ